MKYLKNKVVVITGAGSGIGRALTVAFAREGSRLAINDFNEHSLNETAEMINGMSIDVFTKPFDVSNKDSMFTFADSVLQRFGQVDIVINNAGIGISDYLFHEYDLDLFKKVMDTNFYGVLYGSRAFIPHLLKRPEASLVNLSSIFGLTGIANATAYCASKFAVHGLNQCLMQEYVNTGLTIHSVHPGGINTNIIQNAPDYKETENAFQSQFLKRSPDDAAKVIVDGIRKKRHKILIGSEAYLLDFAVRMMPYYGSRIVNTEIQRKVGIAIKKANQK